MEEEGSFSITHLLTQYTMAKPFLQQIAEHFHLLTSQPGATPLHQYRFIFHNQRAGIFLCHYLEQCPNARPLLLPECTTMNSLIKRRLRLSGGEDPNNELLVIHKIYLAYLVVMGLGPEERSFEDFYDLGQALLRDFDDIDKHLIKVSSFLENLRNHKVLTEELSTFLSRRQWSAVSKLIYDKDADWSEIEAETATEEKETKKSEEMKKRFLDFWIKLPRIYSRAKSLMEKEGLAYEGMMLREAVRQIKKGKLSLTDDGMITVFVGLNAQTPAMYRILDHFRDSGKAIFYWDYFTDPIVKSPGLAGSFVERNTSEYPTPTDKLYHIDFEVPDQAHELHTALISTASAVAQTGAIRKLIEGGWDNIVESLSKPGESAPLYDPHEPLRTAIVLPDESLLLPLLSNMPKGIDKINVTMGYPIKGIPVAAMLSLLLKYWSNYYTRGQRYRLTEVCEILMLTALSKFFSDKRMADARRQLMDQLIDEKRYFIGTDDLQALIEKNVPGKSRTKDILLTIFCKADTLCQSTADKVCYPEGVALTKQVDHLLELLVTESATTEEDEDPEQGMIKYIRRYLIRPQLTSQRAYHKRHAESSATPFSFPVVVDLLRTTISQARIPFSGRPLGGIQVMGLLETRGLDFDTVIIPDAAEGILPTATRLDTTIPFSLRAGYDLPTTDLQEQTRAYNFFRLMSRAKRVIFLYDSRAGDSSEGEPSRYVQLLRDVYHLPMYEAEASFPLTRAEDGGDFIEDKTLVSQYRASVSAKTPTEKVKRLSASRMKDFHTCPRRFYYTAIEGIRDDENLSGVLDKRDSGTLFHTAMQLLYKESEGKKGGLSLNSLTEILKDNAIDIKNAVRKSAELLHLETKESDYNDNQVEMTKILVERMVKADLERVETGGPITYVGGEIEIETTYEGANFKLIIDRIDVQGDTVNVIDYKTGSDSTECDLSKWPTDAKKLVECLKQAKKINGAVIQLLYYCDVMLESGKLNRLLSDNKISIVLPKVRPMILKPGAPGINDGIITLKLPKGKDPNPVVISNYRTNVDSSVKEWLREAVRLVISPDFTFDVDSGSSDGCNYCPASMLCEKYIPKKW